MKESINLIFLVLILLMVIGITFNLLPFWIVLAALVVRLFYTSKHTIGVFLLLFGGILGSTIRFEIPSLPIYGLVLNLIGLLLISSQFKNFKYESVSILMMFTVLIYFFFSYILSPNISDYRAIDKISSIILNGLLTFFAYYTIVHSSKIDNESLTQSLFLLTILFLVHNMNLLGISPTSFFDYEWQRKGAAALLRSMDNETIYVKFVNYQIVGMNALWGLCMYLSQLTLNKKKAIVYTFITLQLVFTSGARQAILGFFIIIFLYCTLFNGKGLQLVNISKKFKYIIGGCFFVYVLFHLLPLLGIEYLTETLSEGDKGREMLRLMGWNLFLKYPLFGAGIGGFNHAYPGMLYPHNFIIEILCECGIIGVLFLLLILVFYFRYQRINLFYLTQNQSFIFLILAAIGIRVMVSGDLTISIGLFSIIFACTFSEENHCCPEKIPQNSYY